MKACKLKSKVRLGIYIVFGISYLWLASRIPYTHDDWDWGLSVGIQQWITASINSRYVGNFFEILMTRSEFLKTVFLSAGYFVLPLIISWTAVSKKQNGHQEHRLLCFVVCNCLILYMDQRIWQQTYGWVAGFANFSLSAVFFLFFLSAGLNVLEENSTDGSIWYCILLFAESVSAQLFIENIAIYSLLFSLLVCTVCYVRNRRIAPQYMAMLLGSVCGLIIMFSSTMYATLLSTGEAIGGYRKFSFYESSGMGQILYNCMIQAIVLMLKIWEYNRVVCIGALILIAILALTKKAPNNKQHRLKWYIIVGNALFAAYLVVSKYYSIPVRWAVVVLANIAYFVLIAVEMILLYWEQRMRMLRLLWIWMSVPLVILPLAVTTEDGPRLFFTTNILLLLFTMSVLSDILKNVERKTSRRLLAAALLCVMMPMIKFGHIYHEIGCCTEQRYLAIETAVKNGDKSIRLPQYPYQEYLWLSEPTDAGRLAFFREFYGIPADVEVVFY